MGVDAVVLSALAEGDAAALAAFYNDLTPATIRTFRPLGDSTSLEVCRGIIGANHVTPRQRYDLVGWLGPVIVAWAFVADLDKERPYLGLVVAEAMQGRGVGRAVLGQLLSWAKDSGIAEVYLMVVTDNRRAIQLYASHGFVTYSEEFDEVDRLPYFHMVADLSGPPPDPNGQSQLGRMDWPYVTDNCISIKSG